MHRQGKVFHSSRRQAILIRVLGDLHEPRGLEAFDSLAARFISADVVPASRLGIFGRVVENIDHPLREADPAALVV